MKNGLALRSSSPRGEGGFTLIEMLVVVLILGLIATVVVVNVQGKSTIAKISITQTHLGKLKAEVELFKMSQNRYPADLDELVRKGQLEEIPQDAWGRPFEYRVPGRRGPFDILSCGEDGLPGGEGPAADLYSHVLREP